MQRWQGAALALVLCSGCVDPLVDDRPGYSRYVLPQGAEVPSAYADPILSGKLATANKSANFTPMPPAVPLANGFANGAPVRYWDFGTLARQTTITAYQLVSCQPDGSAQPTGHPLIVDSVPGDSDYSPFRLIQWVCVTATYQGRVIPSFDALDDAIALQIVTEPRDPNPPSFVNHPVVPDDVALALPNGTQPHAIAYYRGKAIKYLPLDQQERSFPATPAIPGAAISAATPTVYHISLPGQTKTSRVVFSKAFADAMDPNARNPQYSPAWAVSAVELKAKDPFYDLATMEQKATLCGSEAMATLMSITKESDLFAMMNVPNPCVARITPGTTRVNRPFLVIEVPQ